MTSKERKQLEQVATLVAAAQDFLMTSPINRGPALSSVLVAKDIVDELLETKPRKREKAANPA